MKRRDFIKLPVLIPGLKKLLDDFTLPEETPVIEETPTTTFLEKSLEYPDYTSDFSFSWPSVLLNGEQYSLHSSSVTHIRDEVPVLTTGWRGASIDRGYEIKMTIIGPCPSFEGTTDVRINYEDTYTQFEMTDPDVTIEYSANGLVYTDVYCMVKEIHTGMA